MDTPDLSSVNAVVTGASRGVGQGIAHELGEAGATVIVTGRSREGGGTTEGLPGTIDETAQIVDAAGGRGIPLACDHTSDEAVEALVEKIGDEVGRIDLLVNNVWGGYEEYDGNLFELPLEEQPLWRWDKMMATGVRAHYTMTRAMVPLIVGTEQPLIVNISFGDRGRFLGDVQYDMAKAMSTRLAFAVGEKLRSQNIAAVAVFPGFTCTERVEAGALAEALSETHSPRFVGRAVVALKADPDIMEKTGGAYKVGMLAEEYDFVDINGSRPAPFCIPD